MHFCKMGAGLYLTGVGSLSACAGINCYFYFAFRTRALCPVDKGDIGRNGTVALRDLTVTINVYLFRLLFFSLLLDKSLCISSVLVMENFDHLLPLG